MVDILVLMSGKIMKTRAKLMGWSLLRDMSAQMRVIEQKIKEIIRHDVLVRKQELVAK
jgi:hypothetical protein